MAKLVIRHDLETLSKEELTQYLRDVSAFVGLDPDLNALDTIWLPNESGNGQSLVVYARRGTAEILRNLLGIDVDELTDHVVNGSIVFTAKGHDKKGRKEQAIGSKYIGGLTGKVLDDAIMTASTRALRRLTMQFTTLGILDESEVGAVKAEAPAANPAAGVALATNSTPLVFTSTPLVFTQPTVEPNNGPGEAAEFVTGMTVQNKTMFTPSQDPKTQAQVATVIALDKIQKAAVEAPVTAGEPFVGQQAQINEAIAQQAAKQVDTKPAPEPVTPVESTVTPDTEAATEVARPKRARKPKNTVSLDVEPETVNNIEDATNPVVAPEVVAAVVAPPPPAQEANPPAAPQANNAAPVQAQPVSVAPAESNQIGMPTKEQMDTYRQKISAYTSQLPASPDLGSVQKMRAFITHMSGTAPQNMTVTQWEEQIAWFEKFVATNKVKGLVDYINLSLGVK
jgi:hypothetical protein